MTEENLARLRTHRNNIHRYRGLLRTQPTDLERGFIETRISEEKEAAKRLPISSLLASGNSPI